MSLVSRLSKHGCAVKTALRSPRSSMFPFSFQLRTLAIGSRITGLMKVVPAACLFLLLASGLRAEADGPSAETTDATAQESAAADLTVAQTTPTNPAASAAIDRARIGGYFDAQAQNDQRP